MPLCSSGFNICLSRKPRQRWGKPRRKTICDSSPNMCQDPSFICFSSLTHWLFLLFPLDTSDRVEKNRPDLGLVRHTCEMTSQPPRQAEQSSGVQVSQLKGKRVARWLRAQASESGALGSHPGSVPEHVAWDKWHTSFYFLVWPRSVQRDQSGELMYAK